MLDNARKEYGKYVCHWCMRVQFIQMGRQFDPK